MIRYEQVEGRTPKDVKLITDDADAEMDGLTSIFAEVEAEDMATFHNLEMCRRDGDGYFEFIIAGNEVGDVADFIYQVDDGKLEDIIEKWNQEALDSVEDS